MVHDFTLLKGSYFNLYTFFSSFGRKALGIVQQSPSLFYSFFGGEKKRETDSNKNKKITGGKNPKAFLRVLLFPGGSWPFYLRFVYKDDIFSPLNKQRRTPLSIYTGIWAARKPEILNSKVFSNLYIFPSPWKTCLF